MQWEWISFGKIYLLVRDLVVEVVSAGVVTESVVAPRDVPYYNNSSININVKTNNIKNEIYIYIYIYIS